MRWLQKAVVWKREIETNETGGKKNGEGTAGHKAVIKFGRDDKRPWTAQKKY